MFEEVFKMFDKNNSGTVEKAEMATFIKQLAGIDMED
jgi:Ca2+-binding EF-hand superfamily protein